MSNITYNNDMKYPCSAIDHHYTCTGEVDTETDTYSFRKVGSKEYYTRWLCTTVSTDDIVRLHPHKRRWLISFLENSKHFPHDDDIYYEVLNDLKNV